MYLAILQGIATLVMAYFGYHYSVPQATSPRVKWVLRTVFVGLSVVSLMLIGVQAHKTDKDQERAESAQKQAEIAQQTTQRKLDETQSEVASQGRQLKELREKLFGPGSPTEKLVSMADTLGTRVSLAALTALTPRNDIPFKGGTPQRLDDLMKADGYTGTTMMAELYVKNSDTSQSALRIGPSPDLNTKNSSLVEIGERMDYRSGANTATIYILSDKDGKIDVTFRPR